jgi:ankyrin repeat protein
MLYFRKGKTMKTEVATMKTEIVKLLIDNGADVNAIRDWDGRSALIWAASHGRTDIVKLLIDNGADVNAKNNKGETALKIATTKNNTKIVDMLKAAKAK